MHIEILRIARQGLRAQIAEFALDIRNSGAEIDSDSLPLNRIVFFIMRGS